MLPGWACDTIHQAIAVTGSASLPGAVAVSAIVLYGRDGQLKPGLRLTDERGRGGGSEFWVRRGSPSDLLSTAREVPEKLRPVGIGRVTCL